MAYNFAMSDIYFFNTLGREKQKFVSIESNKVGMYTCGPTVYNYSHIGNLRTYIFEDILKGVLQYNSYEVRHIMNITDVGHLTNDDTGGGDTGDDKMEKGAKREGKTVWEVADFFTERFLEDLDFLNISLPNVIAKVTDNIPEQIELIKKLEDKGFTYRIGDGIYFDTSKDSHYTELSRQKIEFLKEGARVEKNDEKRNLSDFALWKFSPKGEQRQMEWESPWGVGFPGWHIECSAIAIKYLGEQFDIHCGAVDAVNIHHTNEIAQSESVLDKRPWVRYWMHGAFLNLNGGEKMAKSSGNFLTLRSEFLDKGLSPLIYRFATLNTHYRKEMEWSDDVLVSAKNGYENLLRKVAKLGDRIGKVSDGWRQKFLQAINDDLNMPQAVGVMNEMLKSDLGEADKLATVLDFDRVFGLKLIAAGEEREVEEEISADVLVLAEQRKKARADKDWALADELRDKAKSLGYEIKDEQGGQVVIKI